MLRGALVLGLSSAWLSAESGVWKELPQDPAPTLKAAVVFVDAKNGFFVINLGKKDGIGAAMEFRIVRKSGNDTVDLGKASFDKYLGRDSMSKLTLTEGDIRDIRVDDVVLCRKI
jgi:hypothetical protein